MSEKREGWLGWMSKKRTVYLEPWGDGLRPVWVQPLDPDGPKPGETWQTNTGTPVEILSPPYHGVVVVCGELWNGNAVGYDVASLSPIKPTRTVTVELTEEEIELVVDTLPGPYNLSSVVSKLAEALEDS